jgi:hypothetical protein
MSEVTREELVELAERYVPVESTQFPWKGDLFAFFLREVSPEGTEEDSLEGWSFNGYGRVDSYHIDEEETPRGKWIYFYYHDLRKYPLEKEVLQLQPPHITRGRFFSTDRSLEIRMMKVDAFLEQRLSQEKLTESTSDTGGPSNLLQFPLKKR